MHLGWPTLNFVRCISSRCTMEWYLNIRSTSTITTPISLTIHHPTLAIRIYRKGHLIWWTLKSPVPQVRLERRWSAIPRTRDDWGQPFNVVVQGATIWSSAHVTDGTMSFAPTNVWLGNAAKCIPIGQAARRTGMVRTIIINLHLRPPPRPINRSNDRLLTLPNLAHYYYNYHDLN